MGTTLTGTTPQDTYDSLIKVTDNGPLSGSLKTLTDGLGNDSALALSTGAASITGTLAVSSTSAFGGNMAINGSANSLDINPTTGQPNITLRSGNTFRGYIEGNASGGLSFGSGASAAIGMTLTSTGNVGIGTSNPTNKLVVAGNIEMTSTANVLFSNNIQVVSSSANLSINASSGSVVVTAGSSERARFTADGLTFNGDTAAANALDDYEEGTWTPSVAFGGASVGLTYGRRGGTYTKIGRQVTVCGDLILSAKGSSTGNATIAGLPFTINGSSTDFLQAASFRFAEMSFSGLVQGYGGVSSTIINMEQVTSGAGAAPITHDDFEDGTQLMVSLTYFV